MPGMEKIDLRVMKPGEFREWQKRILRKFKVEEGRMATTNYPQANQRISKYKELIETLDSILPRLNSVQIAAARKDFNENFHIRQNDFCHFCLMSGNLIRHHIIPIWMGGLNMKLNIIQICSPCHAYLHPWLKKKEGHEVRLEKLSKTKWKS